MTSPLLSFIVASRNDTHGGNLLGRMQLFVTTLLEQARRYHLQSELIIVEWNPPPDRPRLAQVLRWPKQTGPCTVRIIEVPSDVHARFQHADKLPLFQMIGKNVGIRRADGQFILATNIDILFSNELIQWLASGRLRKDRMYRIDRYDVPAEIPDGMSLDEQQVYCRQHIIRVNKRMAIWTAQDGQIQKPPASYRPSLWGHVSRWLRRDKPFLHTNACGDFTLMAREHWFKMRGYAEFEMYSFKIDGLLCYAAHYAGAKEIILKLPMQIYHLEHTPGSGWTPGQGGNLLVQRLNDAGIPRLSSEQYTTWISEMRQKRQPIRFNDYEGWGLADLKLQETIVT